MRAGLKLTQRWLFLPHPLILLPNTVWFSTRGHLYLWEHLVLLLYLCTVSQRHVSAGWHHTEMELLVDQSNCFDCISLTYGIVKADAEQLTDSCLQSEVKMDHRRQVYDKIGKRSCFYKLCILQEIQVPVIFSKLSQQEFPKDSDKPLWRLFSGRIGKTCTTQGISDLAP